MTNSEFSVKAFQDTSNAMMDERMSAIEKKMELLQCIWDKVNVNPAPSFASKSYSAVTRGNDDYSGTGARPKNLTVPLSAGIGRERSSSVKRGLNDVINSQNKRRNVGNVTTLFKWLLATGKNSCFFTTVHISAHREGQLR